MKISARAQLQMVQLAIPLECDQLTPRELEGVKAIFEQILGRLVVNVNRKNNTVTADFCKQSPEAST